MAPPVGVIGRARWGAVGTVPVDPTDKDELGIHHTVHPNLRWTPEQERALLRDVERKHMSREPPFSTIGYSWIVFPSGRVYVGRGRRGIPAGAEGQNTGTWALAFVGDFRRAAPSVLARRTARRLIAVLVEEEGLHHLGGHREFPGQSTECPGDRLMEFVRKWRRDFDLGPLERT